MHAPHNLIQDRSTKTLFLGLFSANGRIWITADIDSANCRIICSPQNIVKTFPKVSIDFVENLSPSFFRARWNSVLHGNQAAGIGSSITVESNGGTARSLSSCTIESPPQSSQGPSVAQRAVRAATPFDSTVMLNPIPGTWSPGDEPGDPI